MEFPAATPTPCPTHARPFEPSIKSHFSKISSTYGDKCPRNGSNNEEMAPRTRTGYPHKGPSVDQPAWLTILNLKSERTGSRTGPPRAKELQGRAPITMVDGSKGERL